MRLSKAILEGCKRFPVKGKYQPYGPRPDEACVLGAAHAALGIDSDADVVGQLQDAFPELRLSVGQAGCTELALKQLGSSAAELAPYTLAELLTLLNDATSLTREEIAALLEAVDL